MEKLIGTSGFSYEDWYGYFYPKSIRKSEFLSFYSKHFRTTEVNSTYYRIPSLKVVEGMKKKVKGNFVFSVKANQVFTHLRDFGDKDVEAMKDVLRAFGNNLGVLLFQFPHSFHKSEHSKDYVKKLRDIFYEYDLAFEFRSAEWISDDTFYLLEKLDSCFVCVDEPRIQGLIPPVFVVTTKKFAYIRFHGRNAQKWYNHEKPEERYDYLYSSDELVEWKEKIISSGELEKLFIYFNNHPRAQAVINAKMMEKLLEL